MTTTLTPVCRQRGLDLLDALSSLPGQFDDPLGYEAGDANLYRYVGNSPTNWIDPSGLVTDEQVWQKIDYPAKPGKPYRDWPVNSQVINRSDEPCWVYTPGGPNGWLQPGESTSYWRDEGDFVLIGEDWYKIGVGTGTVVPGGVNKFNNLTGFCSKLDPLPEPPPGAVFPPGPPPPTVKPSPEPSDWPPPLLKPPLLRPY
jgi:hypothetical protein